MMKDPEWFDKEAHELLEKWANEETELDFPEYLIKHLSKRSKKYYIKTCEYRRKQLEKLIV